MATTTCTTPKDGVEHSSQPSLKALVLAVSAMALVVFCGTEQYQYVTSPARPNVAASLLLQKNFNYDFPIKEETVLTAASSNYDFPINEEKLKVASSKYDFPVKEATTKATGLRQPSAAAAVAAGVAAEATDDSLLANVTTAEEMDLLVSSMLGEVDAAQEKQRKRVLAAPSSSPTQLPFNLKYANGIRYYHRPAKLKKKIDLFLLHSDAFTLRIWRSSGVLTFLSRHKQLATTAVDIDAGSDYNGLRNALKIFASQGIISLPVALVTPSASGWSVVTWMKNDPTTFYKYVKVWIPVAPGGLRMATDGEIINMLTPPNNPSRKIGVLAIYGTGDKSGKKISDRLGQLVKAKVVGLVGNHSVYRQSPGPFAQNIATYLGV